MLAFLCLVLRQQRTGAWLLALIGAWLGLSTQCDFGSAAAAEPRNVLWISADDLATYSLGAYGGQIAQTPQIDAFAESGMVFDRAYCNSPVCTASRQSFLTGRYPRTIGVSLLKTALPESETTLAELLLAHGYETASFGKMHFNSALMHGFELRWDMPQFQSSLAARGKQLLPSGVETLGAWRPFADPASVWLNSRCLPVPAVAADMFAESLVAQTESFLQRSHTRPFFLMVSFTEPHSPFHFPVEYAGRHSAAEFPVYPLGDTDDAQIPAIFRDLTPEQKQGIAAAYHTSVEYLDANVGRVLAALEASGQADETLVILSSDHGYLLGQHGRFEKHCGFEPALRTPLIVRWPGRTQPPARTAALVELLDVFATVLDWCDIPPPENVQSFSLGDVLADPSLDHRQLVFSEYAENEEAYVVSRRYKLIYGTGARERQDGYATGLPLPGRTVRLFDLQADPDELHDLSNDPAQVALVAELTAALAEHLVKTARRPDRLPTEGDIHAVLAACLAPDDVGGE